MNLPCGRRSRVVESGEPPAEGGFAPLAFERELTATPAAFERDLRAAWPGGIETPEAGRFRLHDGALTLEIEIKAAGERRLGLLALPRLVVRYRFYGGEAAVLRQWLAKLDRAMHKGGG